MKVFIRLEIFKLCLLSIEKSSLKSIDYPERPLQFFSCPLFTHFFLPSRLPCFIHCLCSMGFRFLWQNLDREVEFVFVLLAFGMKQFNKNLLYKLHC